MIVDLKTVFGINEDISSKDAQKIKDPKSLFQFLKNFDDTASVSLGYADNAADKILAKHPEELDKVKPAIAQAWDFVDKIDNAVQGMQANLGKVQKDWERENTMLGKLGAKAQDLYGKGKQAAGDAAAAGKAALGKAADVGKAAASAVGGAAGKAASAVGGAAGKAAGAVKGALTQQSKPWEDPAFRDVNEPGRPDAPKSNNKGVDQYANTWLGKPDLPGVSPSDSVWDQAKAAAGSDDTEAFAKNFAQSIKNAGLKPKKLSPEEMSKIHKENPWLKSVPASQRTPDQIKKTKELLYEPVSGTKTPTATNTKLEPGSTGTEPHKSNSAWMQAAQAQSAQDQPVGTSGPEKSSWVKAAQAHTAQEPSKSSIPAAASKSSAVVPVVPGKSTAKAPVVPSKSPSSNPAASKPSTSIPADVSAKSKKEPQFTRRQKEKTPPAIPASNKPNIDYKEHDPSGFSNMLSRVQKASSESEPQNPKVEPKKSKGKGKSSTKAKSDKAAKSREIARSLMAGHNMSPEFKRDIKQADLAGLPPDEFEKELKSA